MCFLLNFRGFQACIVPPAERKENNARNVEALHLNDENNEFLRGTGIRVIPQPLLANARILPPPRVTYNNRDAMMIDLHKVLILFYLLFFTNSAIATRRLRRAINVLFFRCGL